MFARFRWTPEGIALSLVATVVSTYFAIVEGQAFLGLFPQVYGWSELLLSYEGGIVRRGLLGEIAYQLHPIIDARQFLTWSMVILYAVVYATIIAVCCRNLNLGSLLFLVSPGALLFTVNDLGAFARKDIVTLGSFLLALMAIRYMRSAWGALAATMALYLVAALTHETALAYFPMAVAFLLHTKGRERSQRWSWLVVGAAFAFAFAVASIVYVYRGDPSRVALMVSRWRDYIPDAFTPLYAAEYLGNGVGGNFGAVVADALYAPTIAGFAAAAVLVFLPIAAYTAYRPPRLSSTPLHMAAVVLAFAALATPGFLASDWGRYLYLAGLHTFIFFACLGSEDDLEAPRRIALPRTPSEVATLVLWAMLIFCYAGMWRILHWAHQVSAFHRGFLFDLIDKLGTNT